MALTALLPLISAGAQVLPFFGAQKKQKKALKEQRNLLDALTNTNNPIFQETYKQQKELGQQNLAETIAELQRQNRKQSMLGRTPLFSPERGGETLFRGVTRGYQDIQNEAQGSARNLIANRLQGLQGIYPEEQQSNLMGAGMQSVIGEFLGSKKGKKAINSGIKSLSSIFGIR